MPTRPTPSFEDFVAWRREAESFWPRYKKAHWDEIERDAVGTAHRAFCAGFIKARVIQWEIDRFQVEVENHANDPKGLDDSKS